MIFTAKHAEMIMDGTKWQTIRRADKRCPKVGNMVAIQPGRTKKAIGRKRVVEVEIVWDIDKLTPEQVRADGFDNLAELLDCLETLHRCEVYDWAWIRIEFERAEATDV